MIIVLLLILAFTIVWSILSGLVFIKKALNKREYDLKDVVRSIIEYLRRRSDRIVFLKFLLLEEGCAGLLPQINRIFLDIDGWQLCFELGYGADWVSAIVAVIVGVGYYMYLKRTSWARPEHWDDVVEAARLMQEHYVFQPHIEWFCRQNNKAIRELGNRYSKEINFPFEDMPWLLAALRVGDSFASLIRDDLNDFVESARSLLKMNIKDRDDEKYNSVRDGASETLTCLSNLSADGNTYLLAREKTEELIGLIYNYQGSVKRSEYIFESLRQKADRLLTKLNNKWIELKNPHVWFVVGAAGTGKSHLLADIVIKRQRNNEPSILLLGEKFNNQDEPLSQIVSMLDYPGRKELWLRNLNHYGMVNKKTVAIFIDGLNERGGESLWSAHLIGLIDDIERFEYLRLIVSFRISGAHNWFYDMAYNYPEYAVYHHKGFEGKESVASEFIFSSFGLDQPLWPAFGSEFANPLFLIKYCKVHEGKGLPLEYECFWNTILQYCNELNHDISIRFHYNDSLHIVTNALKAIAELMVEDTGRWYLNYDKAIEKMTEVAKFTQNPQDFLGLLIDDGILRIERYKDDNYVNFGFERVGDYFMADCLIEKGLIDKDDYYRYGSDVEEALSVIAPLKTGKEIFELVNDEHRDTAINSFLRNTAQRDIFTEKGQTLLQRLLEKGYEQNVLEIILERPFRSDSHANSDTLYEILSVLTMKERDAIWSIKISETWGYGSHLNELALWAINASDKTLGCVVEDNIRLCAEALVWSLSSTWKELRDRATHALVKIMSSRKTLVLPLLVKFHSVNDPYIEERLWASVMGSVVCAQSEQLAKEVAEWTYHNLFAKDKVPVHILVRDYAKSIIRYAQSLGLELDVNEEKMALPLSNERIPEHIISCEDVKAKYDIEWSQIKDDDKDRDLHIANSKILSSMATEHSPRTSMYGDFGRYVFQSNLYEIPVDPESMANWAIEMIFEEYGYDAKLFAQFDIHLDSYHNYGSRVERIGKKYQWIAMYKIMAVLEDEFKKQDFERRLKTLVRSARNIDPTFKKSNFDIATERSIYEVPKYDVSVPENDDEWMKSWKDMPVIEDYLIVKDKEGIEWVNLFSYNTIKKMPDAISENYMQRDLWTFVQAFAVNSEHLKAVCDNIHQYGLEGRRFRENCEIDGLFLREFYWSDEYKRFILKTDYGFAPFEIGNRSSSEIMIAPAYLIYSQSSSEDASSVESVSMLLPNDWLFRGLGLRYGSENGVWVDKEGIIIALDNSHYGKGHEALLVRKDVLLGYLKREGLTLFWPILIERQLWNKYGSWANHQQNGGWAYMDNLGKIHHKFRLYERSETCKKIDDIKEKWLKTWIPIKYEVLLWLHRKRVIHLSEDTIWKIMGQGPSSYYYEESPWNQRKYKKLLKKLEEDGVIVDNDNHSTEDDDIHDVDSDFQRMLEFCSKWDDEKDEVESEDIESK